MAKVRVTYETLSVIEWEYKPDTDSRCNVCGKIGNEEMLNMYAGNCLDCFSGCS